MALRDPVLDREMFNPRGQATKANGITSLVDDGTNTPELSDREIRKQKADAMLEEAKQKHDPSNFQVLEDQDRPGVFRPTATAMPQAMPQQPNTAQQMAQMQQMGIRIPGFADGGDTSPAFRSSALDQYTPLTPSIDPDVAAFNALGSKFQGIKQTVQGLDTKYPTTAVPVSQMDSRTPSPTAADILTQKDPSTWSDSDIEMLAKAREYEAQAAPSSRAGRGIKSLLGVSQTAEDFAADLRRERDTAKETQGRIAATQSLAEKVGGMGVARLPEGEAAAVREDTARRSEASRNIPVPGLFSTSTPEEVSRGEAARSEAVSSAETQQGREALGNIPSERDKRDYAGDRTQEGLMSLSDIPVARPDKRDFIGDRTPAAATPAADNGIASLTGSAGDFARTIPSGAETASASPAPSPSPATAATATATPGIMNLPEMKEEGSTSMADIKAQRVKESSQNFNLALMQAGLAMAAGKSHNALENIGVGGIQGLQAYTQGEQVAQKNMRENIGDLRAQQAAARDLAYKNAQMGIEGSRLGMEGQRLDIARAGASQAAAEFGQKMAFEHDTLAQQAAIAIANRDATLGKATSESLNRSLDNISAHRAQISINANANLLNPEQVKAESANLDRQEALVRRDLQALQSQLGLHLPSASSRTPSDYPQTNENGWMLHQDSSGKLAYVSPDGKQFEEVK